MSPEKQKVKRLMALALDKRTPPKERRNAAYSALRLIEKYDLLFSPLDGVLPIDNETVNAAVHIGKKIIGEIGKRRRYR